MCLVEKLATAAVVHLHNTMRNRIRNCVAMTKCESGRERNTSDGGHGETSAQVLLLSVQRCSRLQRPTDDSTRPVDIILQSTRTEVFDAEPQRERTRRLRWSNGKLRGKNMTSNIMGMYTKPQYYYYYSNNNHKVNRKPPSPPIINGLVCVKKLVTRGGRHRQCAITNAIK